MLRVSYHNHNMADLGADMIGTLVILKLRFVIDHFLGYSSVGKSNYKSAMVFCMASPRGMIKYISTTSKPH